VMKLRDDATYVPELQLPCAQYDASECVYLSCHCEDIHCHLLHAAETIIN
jgi:hypothetical protein